MCDIIRMANPTRRRHNGKCVGNVEISAYGRRRTFNQKTNHCLNSIFPARWDVCVVPSPIRLPLISSPAPQHRRKGYGFINHSTVPSHRS
ncbi:hypothetical protein GDO78_004792 [Eleutherodactylus coqui]|uniref:Uncharacterized protein n=1 Tax=Eleutherodactylus coqui TaxID=57060 RepID=A0A8J6ET84_ELECQ|nr:hypothetical protein GDO78_004792 [Eleutherodactylus coqui]